VVVLVVVDEQGQPAYASVVAAHPDPCAAADSELAAAGWVRRSGWDPAAGVLPPAVGLPCTAVVGPVPRVAVTAADQRSLDALRRLTAMARGPVTAGALVPDVTPRWQVAASLLRRLVAAGQVRCVGRTADRARRPLYAPVGSPWAEALPAHEEQRDRR